jgi:hypothetical protein
MGDRAGANCVVGSTKVIPQVVGPEAIKDINVVQDIVVDFSVRPPIVSPVGVNPIGNVTPIKSLAGTYVYPAIRYKYTSDASYPLIQMQVKIPPTATTPTTSPCQSGDLCTTITSTFLHTFMNEFGTIVPAYCIEAGDKIFVDPNLLTREIGIVLSVNLVQQTCAPWPPQDVYGLIVMDIASASNIPTIIALLMAQVNKALAEHWQQNVEQHKKLELPPSRLEANDFAISTFGTLLSEYPEKYLDAPVPGATLRYGLTSQELMIITDLIASGTLDVQRGYYREARRGINLNTLIP